MSFLRLAVFRALPLRLLAGACCGRRMRWAGTVSRDRTSHAELRRREVHVFAMNSSYWNR